MRIYLLLIALYAFFSAPAPHAQNADPVKGVKEFLTPDGRFDLEKARRSRFEGSLNTTGIPLGIDAWRQPVPRASAKTANERDSSDVTSSLSSSFRESDEVNALEEYDGKLIVGGFFAEAGGVSARSIAAWDGVSWAPLGEGVEGAVNALTVYNGKLIVGASTGSIWAWDGSSWELLGEGTYSAIYAFAVYDGKLIVGGHYLTFGGIPANDIAAWDGSSWSSLGDGITPSGFRGIASLTQYVLTLTVYENKLIAGGFFSTAGGMPINGIAAWDGTSWAALGDGLWFNGEVDTLAAFQNKLYAGGIIVTDPEGNYWYSTAIWDGTSWTTFGKNMSLRSFTVFDNKLIGSLFNNNSSYLINVLDRDEWEYLYKFTGTAEKLKTYNNTLVAVGDFTTANGKPIYHLASWTKEEIDSPTSVSELPTVPSPLLLSPTHPNPFNPSTTIGFTIPVESRVTVKIFNVAGQEVATLKDEKLPAGKHTVTWEAKGMPSGVYVCSVKAGKFSETRKMTLVK